MNKLTSFKSLFVRIPILGAILPLLALLIPALFFLPNESLWTDETTVLSGLTLGPIEIIGWLTGQFHHFNVPPDNAPPLGYWLEMVWSSIFGISEISLRYFALVVVGIAVFVVYETARIAFGFKSGLLAGFLFALSPNVIEQAVNIRVYPIFLLLSACGFYCMIRFFGQPASNRNKWLMGMVVFSVLATYSHFFGLLMAGSLLMAVLTGVWREGESLKPVIVAIFIVGVSAIGLLPFLIAMFSHLGSRIGGSNEGIMLSTARLFYRQFAHPAMSISIIAAISGAVGFLALLALSVIRKGSENENLQKYSILTALIAGLIVIVLGRIFVSPLVTEIRYNLWILPGLCVFLSSSLAVTFRFSKIIKVMAVVLLLGADVYAASQFIVHGSYFSHSRFTSINRCIQKLGPDNVTVIHDGDAGAIFFPIEYTYGSKINQFYVMHENKCQPVLKKFPDLKINADLSVINTKFILLLRTEPINTTDIANQVRKEKTPLSDSAFQAIIDKSENWHLVASSLLISYFQTDMKVYEKK